MAETMKGLILTEKGKVALGERPIPKPGPLEALVRTTCVATCNTDHEIVEELIMPPAVGRFVGHEGVGVVEAVGSEVQHFKVGDRICVPSLTPSWDDITTQKGWPQFGRGGMAFDWCLTRDGTFGEFFCVRNVDMNCAKIPDNVNDIQAVMVTDMLSTAWNGVEKSEIEIGNSVVVFGIGPVGLCSIGAAILKGAGRVYAVGTNPKGAELAKMYGATDIISYKDGDIVEQILELNGGAVDVSIVAGGPASCMAQAITMTRGGGSVCSVNAFYEDVVIPVASWNSGMKTQTIKGHQCTGGRDLFERYLAMISIGRFDPEPIVSHTFKGLEGLEDCLWAKKDADCIKPVCVL